MSDLKFNLVSNGDTANITVFIDGELFSMSSDNMNWDTVLRQVFGGYVDKELFTLAQAVAEKFERVTDRITVQNGVVYVDGDPVEDVLVNHIVRAYGDGVDFEPLIRFYDKISQNPNEHSRRSLYRWLDAHDFTILPDGDILGYKGVNAYDDHFWSISSGTAWVNDVRQTGNIKQAPGDVVTMPRSNVTHDTTVGCAAGLHVGTFNYASNFAKNVIQVFVNPRDVVSVPTECNDQKMRVCRYRVGEPVAEPVAEAVAKAHYSHDLEKSFYPDSSFIEFVSWRGYSHDTENGILNVVIDDKTYSYKDVPVAVVDDFAKAMSPGRYYNLCVVEQYDRVL